MTMISPYWANIGRSCHAVCGLTSRKRMAEPSSGGTGIRLKIASAMLNATNENRTWRNRSGTPTCNAARARQISAPIAALLEAAGQVRKGNLGYRITAAANDEMASLVRAFNEMTTELDGNSRELETRRRFTEAILESIPTGVISLSKDGQIQRVNRAMRALMTDERVDKAGTLPALFPAEETAEIRYLMKRAQRTGSASGQFALTLPGQVLHLAVTVSALPAREADAPAFVVVIEDTSELLRAQKAHRCASTSNSAAPKASRFD